MDTIVIACGNCEAHMKVRRDLPAGKKIRCPNCGAVNAMPEVEVQARPVTAVKAAPSVAARAVSNRAEASPPLPVTTRRRPVRSLEYEVAPRRSRDERDMEPAEYAAAIIFAPVGLLIGLVWQMQGKAKAMKMISISALMSMILAAALGIFLFVWKSQTTVVGPKPQEKIEQTEQERRREQERYRGGRSEGSRPNLPPVSNLDEIVGRAAENIVGLAPERQGPMKANVYIQVPQFGAGSGVVIAREDAEAIIVTNRHVIDEEFALNHQARKVEVNISNLPNPEVVFYNKEMFSAKIVWISPQGLDLAVIRCQCPKDIEPVKCQPAARIEEGVFAVGNPLGKGWTITKGNISRISDERVLHEGDQKYRVIQMTADLNPGNSGGGVYNEKGELLGINTFIFDKSVANAFNFAIHIEMLLKYKPQDVPVNLATAPNNPGDANTQI